MEIQIKTPKAQPLYKLKDGECFEYCHNYFIVTDERIEDEENIKCVNLKSGYLSYFPYKSEVFKMDAIITLRRIGEET